MSTPVLTFFNNKGGVGKTSLIYHLAWAYAQFFEKTVVAVDLDSQANLTSAFLEEDEIEELWSTQSEGSTIYRCVQPLAGVGDIIKPVLKRITKRLYLIPGDVALSGFEDTLSTEWPRSLENTNLYRPMRVLSAFWQVMQMAAEEVHADLLLVDIGPQLGAVNRSVMLATDYVVIPLGADLFSLQGLQNLGPTMKNWKASWQKRLDNWTASEDIARYKNFQLPKGQMQPLGYLCQQPVVRLSRPVQAYEKWIEKIPGVYAASILGTPLANPQIKQSEDANSLGIIKHYRSLIPLGQEARKPIFKLTSADGAIGSHAGAVRDAKDDFIKLATTIWEKIISK